MELIKIGYWESAEEPNLPDPTTLPQIDPTVKHFVLQYLKTKAKVHTSWKGYSHCRFNCGIDRSKMGSRCMTDGTYMWPEGLSHYIEEHNVSPGFGFITHIMTQLNYEARIYVKHI